MTKELVEDIMSMENDAEHQLAKAALEKDAIMHRAHQQALLAVQEAEHTLDSERAECVNDHDRLMHERKQQIITDAKTEAQALADRVRPRIATAAERLVQQFFEHTHDVS